VGEIESLNGRVGNQLSATEVRVQQLTIAIVEQHGHGTKAELEEVIKDIGHKKAVAILMLIGRYVMHALIANSLELEPPVNSPL
jgi:hypothetical protein